MDYKSLYLDNSEDFGGQLITFRLSLVFVNLRENVKERK